MGPTKEGARGSSCSLQGVFERLVDLETELDKLESELSELYAAGDQTAAAAIAGRRIAELRPVVDAYREYRQTESELAEANEMLGVESDPEMRDLFKSEVEDKERRRAELETELKELLIPKDLNDGKNVIVEIRGAEGGEEANIWAGDLYRMYQHYAENASLEDRAALGAAIRHGWLP